MQNFLLYSSVNLIILGLQLKKALIPHQPQEQAKPLFVRKETHRGGMQPCHHTGHSSSWHNLLDATFQKKLWAKTQLWTLGEPGHLPHTSGCPYHLAFSLPAITGTNAAF